MCLSADISEASRLARINNTLKLHTMELRNGAFIKATVNGKKAGFVVANNSIWLLSYVSAWDDTTSEQIPMHSFFKKKLVWIGSQDLYGNHLSSFEEWRDHILQTRGGHICSFIETVAFPGEEGYEREIRRRNRRNSSESTRPNEATQTEAHETVERPDIDFYLPNYSTDNIYQGQNSYHASHTAGYLNQPAMPFTGYRIGVELEVEANSSTLRSEIIRKTSNWFTRESDSSLGDYGIEFITIPLLPEDAKSYTTWQPLCNYLTAKAKSWDTGRCGLHVHIGREILGTCETERQMTLGKLLIFYQGDVENWVKATAVFGRSRCYHQPDGDTDEIKAVKCLGTCVLKDPDVFAKVDTAMKSKFGTGRYYAVNLQNRNTIEFRKGRGSINADRIIAVVTMTEAICLFARETQPQDLTLENFQQWLFLNVPCGNPLFRYLNIMQPDA